MSERHHGRLELTWTNKDQCLLAHEDGSYEWVPPTDYRVAEVRLLREAGVVGTINDSENLLINGDALSGLHALAELPEWAEQYVGNVRLAYLDPPFNTQQSFLQYDDALEHSVWLTMLRDRLVQIRRLLSVTGSVWVHCDDYEQAHVRVMMDELFGRTNFVATIVWQRRDGRPNDAVIGQMHDYIIVYANNAEQFAASRNRLSRTDEQESAYRNPDDDPRGLWRNDNYTSNKTKEERPNSWFPIIRPADGAEIWPKPHAVWRYSPERHAQNVAEDRLWWGATGLNTMPKLKRFRSEVQDVVPMTWWPFAEVGSTRNAKNEIKALIEDVAPFATPKPERLLQRVIQIASDPGDVVLDCFLGSGTTAAVAHKMGRRWIGIERERGTLDTFTIERIRKVVAGEDPGGITEDVGWAGGGGFRILNVHPSMFDEDEGVIFLADWAVSNALSEATAAQLGFAYESAQPFCGRKGRSRLAVIDGLVSPAVIELLVNRLGDDEQLVVCGTSVDPDAPQALRDLRPGSRVRKIPASLLTEYQEATRWRPRVTDPAPASGTLPRAVPANAGGA